MADFSVGNFSGKCFGILARGRGVPGSNFEPVFVLNNQRSR
jgi:hypothetical protein